MFNRFSLTVLKSDSFSNISSRNSSPAAFSIAKTKFPESLDSKKNF